jgi:predicted house-cleaning noncanonical NTP pyrophosphatase (MazG superfamily)
MGVKTRQKEPTGDAEMTIIREAFAISQDLGKELERLLAEDVSELSEDAADALLKKIVEVLKRAAARRGDKRTLAKLAEDTEIIVKKVKSSRKRDNAALREVTVPVTPRQVFHGRKVDLYQKRMSTKDIELWTENERLDVHLEQFRTMHGHTPSNDEMLSIMHGVLQLPGVGAGEEEDAGDPFKIKDLADNIAKNGVRRAPILDHDGSTLLDGNRRVAACYYILNSPDYDVEAKKQAESIIVWQLTEHADDEDRQAVIVSLNFEDECKVIWPDYVRAKKVKLEYDSICMRIGQQNLDAKRELGVRKELAKKYALKMARLSLFLQMVKWAEKFEAYHIDEMERDVHEVRHFAKNKFSYFKELSDIDHILDQDDEYRAMVFDLLYQGKFRNWETVRLLRHRDDKLDRELHEAHAEPDVNVGKRNVTLAVNGAYQRHLDKRPPVGANEMIESFVKFLGKLPPSAYLDPDTVDMANLRALKSLCAMSLKNTEEALRARAPRSRS